VRAHDQRQCGFAAIVAVAALALCSVTVLLVSAHLQRRLAELRLEARTVTLIALGDGALDEALAGLAGDPEWSGAGPHALGDGTISSRVTAAPDGRLTVTAVARFEAWRSITEAAVELTPEGPRLTDWRRSQGPVG
jgi:hypothetical protein